MMTVIITIIIITLLANYVWHFLWVSLFHNNPQHTTAPLHLQPATDEELEREQTLTWTLELNLHKLMIAGTHQILANILWSMSATISCAAGSVYSVYSVYSDTLSCWGPVQIPLT